MADAKAHGINVSSACETELVLELKKAQNARWREENREAIASWNMRGRRITLFLSTTPFFSIASARRRCPRKYVAVVHSNYLSDLNTKSVVPLCVQVAGGKTATRLNPILSFAGDDYVLVTQHAAALKLAQLGRVAERVSTYRDDIASALDLLITSF